MGKFIDLTGEKFGRLTVVSRVGTDKWGKSVWQCKCDCGSSVTMSRNQFVHGNTKSCGCLKKEQSSGLNRSHGMSRTRLYKLWAGMRKRCNNPNAISYPRYGGRGIKLCDEWNEFSNFHAWAMNNGYNDTLTIERIDYNKGYSPDNCSFITLADQGRNTSRVHLVLCDDGYLSLIQVSQIVGVCYDTARKWYVNDKLRTLDQYIYREAEINNSRHSRNKAEVSCLGS